MKSARDLSLPSSLPREFDRSGQRWMIRHLQSEDFERFRAFFNALDPETVRCRFGYMISHITDLAAKRMIAVNPLTEPSLAVFDQAQLAIYAVGRYYLNEKSNCAEVAIVVAKPMRRKGFARLTLETLIALAQQRNVTALHAYVMTSDAPVILLLESMGFVSRSRTSDGDLRLTLVLTDRVPTGRSVPVIES